MSKDFRVIAFISKVIKPALIGFVVLLGLNNPFDAMAQKAQTFTVTLVGSGVPPSDGKASSSILVEAGEQKLLRQTLTDIESTTEEGLSLFPAIRATLKIW